MRRQSCLEPASRAACDGSLMTSAWRRWSIKQGQISYLTRMVFVRPGYGHVFPLFSVKFSPFVYSTGFMTYLTVYWVKT